MELSPASHKIAQNNKVFSYLTAYSIVFMHGLMLSILRHFAVAADMFLDTNDKLLHWTWSTDSDDDRHKWRLSKLDRINWRRVAIYEKIWECLWVERAREIIWESGWWMYGCMDVEWFVYRHSALRNRHVLLFCRFVGLTQPHGDKRRKFSFREN